MNHKQEIVRELAEEMLAAGFRVFLAESGTHGFYTNREGTRVVSFQYRLVGSGVEFSGNYKSEDPARWGTGWCIETSDKVNFKEILNATPPRWAATAYMFTTLDQHLETYQRSSKYTELQP